MNHHISTEPFKDAVARLVRSVPAGMVTTYGDVAAQLGHPRAARQVGGSAHYGDPSVPWHRLVRSNGSLAEGYPGGSQEQALVLGAEGVACEDGVVKEFVQRRWRYLA